MVAPMVYGAGIQNKILEGMASGVPVVCSPQATAALQAQLGHDLLVADSPSGIASAVLRLLGDASLRARLREAGRQYVETYHDWGRVAARLEEVYLQAIAKRANEQCASASTGPSAAS
jgi:hypothetical protein